MLRPLILIKLGGAVLVVVCGFGSIAFLKIELLLVAIWAWCWAEVLARVTGVLVSAFKVGFSVLMAFGKKIASCAVLSVVFKNKPCWRFKIDKIPIKKDKMPSLALKFILSPKNMIFRHYSIKSSKSQYKIGPERQYEIRLELHGGMVGQDGRLYIMEVLYV